MGQPCQVWISEHLLSYLGTLEPCVDMHRTVSYIAWSYWGQERSGGTEALQMFFISGPQGKSVTTTPGSFCSELRGRVVTLCHSLAIWLKIDLRCWRIHGHVNMDFIMLMPLRIDWQQSHVYIMKRRCAVTILCRSRSAHVSVQSWTAWSDLIQQTSISPKND